MRSTFLTDGSSDRLLLPALRWLLARLSREPFELNWADLRSLPQPPRHLDERIAEALRMYPCELLFVHRDAERQAPEKRYAEVRAALRSDLPHVAVVPVRMQEAWLLHDEPALRRAAGRPSGREPLGLPSLKQVEGLPDPKGILHEALRRANGARGRRAKRFSPDRAAYRLADLVTDWSPLRALPAFRRLEDDTRAALVAVSVPAGS